MKRRMTFHLIALLLMASLVGASATSLAQERKGPPKTRTDNVTETLHGVTITDPYRWLEDKDSPETRAWLKEQGEYTKSLLDKVPGRDQIRRRLAELMKTDTIGIPAQRGDRYFITKRRADQNQSVLYLRKGLDGRDEVLLDPNSMSADQSTSVSTLAISEDGSLLVYGIREGGKDEVSVRILDVNTRKELADRMPEARYSGILLEPDKKGFYYSRFTKEGPRVYYHRMGADIATDQLVFGDGFGLTNIISAELAEGGRWLMFYVSHGSSGDKVEVYAKDLRNNGPIKPIVNDVRASFSGTVIGDRLYMRTDMDAPNYRIVEVDLNNPARGNWKTLIPEPKPAKAGAAAAVLTGYSLIGGKLFVSYMENVNSHVKMYELSGKFVREITFPSLGSGSGISGRWGSPDAFFTFNSFGRPTTIYRYHIPTGKQEEWARLSVPVNSDMIEVKQVWYESKDKTRVPMFVAHKKGLKLDGNNPTLLHGYGGFKSSQTAGFSARAAYWVESGGVYALANLRGGGEFGEAWHRAGMLEQKQNTFDDFIAAAEYLIKSKYTSSKRLAISGGSNGGLLVGAAMTQRPDLFQAVLCSVPLLDMVRYHNFLVARFWVPEYGSSENPEQFKYIHAYSPYHNVKPGTKYPAVMFVTGDSDTRVDPLHARKMAALMQASTGSDRPVLLHYDPKAGHSSGLPISKQIEDLTDQMSFLFWQLGMAPNGERTAVK